MAELNYTRLSFADLSGWSDDDHKAAFDVFMETCQDLEPLEWQVLHRFGLTNPNPQLFFERFFEPVMIEDGEPTVFTAYYEPELPGSLTPGGDYQFPIYSLPEDLDPSQPYHTRRQIEEDKPLVGQNLEIAWLSDPVDLFFLQVQGSGRISLPDGQVIRVGYSGKNGHPYTSVGSVLVERGIFEAHQVSAPVIRNWVKENRAEGYALLWENKSYVFFREVSEVPPALGPLGAMNRSITAHRSIAVDPEVTPLGAPVWIEKQGAEPINRLMVAQDTGSAIKGAQRADIFFGTGEDAGRAAGQIRDSGRMVVLLPGPMAQRLDAL